MVMQPSRIKLLKFISRLGIAGTERQFMNLGRSLDPGRFELHFACFQRWGQFLDEVAALRIPLAEYNIKSLYHPKILKEQMRFAGYLKRHRIHIVHAYGFYPNVFTIPAAWLAGAPVIVASIRDTGGYETPTKSLVQKFVCRLADHIVVNAEAIRQGLLAEGYDPEKVTVIRNGIDLSLFTTTTRGNGLREQLGLPQRAPLIAVLARLHPFKGIEHFLEAAAIVAGRFQDARFLIVGEGQIIVNGQVEDSAYKRELERHALRLGLGGRVVFTGFRLDVPELLSEVAVSVLPCVSSEGLSNSLLESMAAGVPVVATRVGGNPEVVEEGVTGLLVPPRDPQALASGICRLLENPELGSRFGRAGRQRVTQHFSLERMVRETETLYLQLIRKARAELGSRWEAAKTTSRSGRTLV
jgi:glycosyltransferase involved in cell wall biosynthesis